MKHFFINILLLSVYIAAMFRPAIYFVEYFANYDYIKEELCKNKNKPFLKCNGTCYVESQLKAADLLDNGSTQKSNLPEVKLFFPIFVLNTINVSFPKAVFLDKKNTPNFSKHFVIHNYINGIFRPPQIA